MKTVAYINLLQSFCFLSYYSCCVMLDAMAIRQQLLFNRHTGKIVGYTDLGMDEGEDNDVAKEALVVMVVGLKAKWKAPISFYLINGISAELQSSLLKMCLEKLVDCGLVVHAVTMDGHATNLAMCRLLGCCLDVGTLTTWFSIPNQTSRIWIILDVCHMVKLIRNSLEALQTIQSPNGLIKWRDIETLNKIQNNIGLRSCNKLSDRHVNFHQQIMKVSNLYT